MTLYSLNAFFETELRVHSEIISSQKALRGKKTDILKVRIYMRANYTEDTNVFT